MPNTCTYTMLIMGTKENCYKWFEKLEGNRNFEESIKEDKFFGLNYNVDPYIYEESGSDEEYTMVIDGCCRWSLWFCCIAGDTEGIDVFSKYTKELSLKMEAWSEELLDGIHEHYIYEYGERISDEEFDD